MQLESLVNGASIHKHANLVAAYRSAVAEAKTSGMEKEYHAVAREAERALRILLLKLRLCRAGG